MNEDDDDDDDEGDGVHGCKSVDNDDIDDEDDGDAVHSARELKPVHEYARAQAAKSAQVAPLGRRIPRVPATGFVKASAALLAGSKDDDHFESGSWSVSKKDVPGTGTSVDAGQSAQPKSSFVAASGFRYRTKSMPIAAATYGKLLGVYVASNAFRNFILASVPNSDDVDKHIALAKPTTSKSTWSMTSAFKPVRPLSFKQKENTASELLFSSCDSNADPHTDGRLSAADKGKAVAKTTDSEQKKVSLSRFICVQLDRTVLGALVEYYA